MILKRFGFPILLFILFCYSCDKDAGILKPAGSKQYDKNISKGFLWMGRQQYDSAFYYFENAKNTSRKPDEKVYALLQMAAIQQLFCDFSGSEATATEAYENAGSTSYLPYIYNTLGIAYEEQGYYEEALKYYNKCKNSNLKGLYKRVADNNIAVVYLEKKEYGKAIKILQANIASDSLKADQKQYAKSLDNLGYCLFKTNDPKAIGYLKKSEALRNTVNDDYEKIASCIHLSEYYQNSNTPLALDFAEKTYQSATKVNSPDDRIEALKFWIGSARPMQVKKLALRQIRISDSIGKVRQSAKNQFAKIKYDSRKAIKEKERAELQKQRISIGFVFVVVLLLVIILLVRYTNRKKLSSSVYDTETRIAKKIHDELANDVFQAMNYAENQDLQNPEKKETLIQNLDHIYAKTRNISQSNSDIDTGANYDALLLALLNSHNNDRVNVIIKDFSVIEWDKLRKEIKTAVYRVLQELMVNMKKHSGASIVVASFENHPKRIMINYSDNGKGAIGLDHNKKGIHNAENRIQAIKGTIIFESEADKGFRVKITIPK